MGFISFEKMFLPISTKYQTNNVVKNIALLTVLVLLVGVAIYSINILNQFAVLQLLSNADYLTVFEVDQLYAKVMFYLDLHHAGYLIAQLLSFGPWLLPFGFLVFKSGFLPKILGILLMIACFGYLIESFQFFLIPDYEVITYPGLAVTAIAEIGTCLWLLIRGVNQSKMKSVSAQETTS